MFIEVVPLSSCRGLYSTASLVPDDISIPVLEAHAFGVLELVAETLQVPFHLMIWHTQLR